MGGTIQMPVTPHLSINRIRLRGEKRGMITVLIPYLMAPITNNIPPEWESGIAEMVRSVSSIFKIFCNPLYEQKYFNCSAPK